MPSKLKNQKTVVDNIEFDSKRESMRYLKLKAMQEAGEITDLQLQVKFPLLPKQRTAEGKAIRAVDYVADFVYMKDGEKVVEDSKGFRVTSSASYQVFVLKKKMMKYFHNIDIMEV